MPSKFKNKYRIPSARLQNWDYSSNAAYFITICTQHREYYFGNVKEGVMHLSEIGQFAEQYWKEIPNHFPFVKLGNFVIMPNHMHGILIINNPVGNVSQSNEDVKTLQCNVSTMAIISPKPGSIATIIRSYKSIVTRTARNIHADFGWQSRYYDCIIKNAIAFDNIQNYIQANPENWKKDDFYL